MARFAWWKYDCLVQEVLPAVRSYPVPSLGKVIFTCSIMWTRKSLFSPFHPRTLKLENVHEAFTIRDLSKDIIDNIIDCLMHSNINNNTKNYTTSIQSVVSQDEY